jgi:N-acyl homoserine lactone hydrolase
MKPKIFLSLLAVLVTGLLYSFVASDANHTSSPIASKPGLRLYVFDGGTIENIDPSGFGLKKEQVSFNRFPVPCFLIVHPKGTLIWDAGAVSDNAWKYTGASIQYRLVLPDRQRDITLTRPLAMQLVETGYSPKDITYFALSHYHYDHTGNANQFANSTWLVRQNEYDAMFAETPPNVTLPSSYSALRKSRIKILSEDEYDVFGDSSVIIKSAPGHTPGHQVLFLKLVKTGNVVLSGDLYHYPEEKTFDKVPIFEFNAEQTRVARALIDTFLKKTGATLWIQHDLFANEKLEKSPAYYE